jgi:hypothetical protein
MKIARNCMILMVAERDTKKILFCKLIFFNALIDKCFIRSSYANERSPELLNGGHT